VDLGYARVEVAGDEVKVAFWIKGKAEFYAEDMGKKR